MIAQSMLPEFDYEMSNTRKILAIVPDGRDDWVPHSRSMPLGRLAAHIANMTDWIGFIVLRPHFDIAPVSGPSEYIIPPYGSTAANLERFDSSVRAGRAILEAASDADLMTPWTFKVRGHDTATLPRVAFLRNAVLNHIIHHRGQLTVYLRLNEVPLPGLYGPSADNPM
jgi:uncharacterized damage-inducible protein DinB